MRRWMLTLAVLLVLLFVGAVAVRTAFYYQGIRSGTLHPEDVRFAASRSVSAVLAANPIPEGEFSVGTDDDPILGAPDAALTVIEFADFGCPYSREASFTLRSVARDYGDRVRFQYRDFPIVELHPDAEKAAEAANCAFAQGKFWEYHDKLYQNQSDQSSDALVRYARELNLNTEAFRTCLLGGDEGLEVADDYQAGVVAGVAGTPTFFINGTRIPGSIPENILRGLLDSLLAANTK